MLDSFLIYKICIIVATPQTRISRRYSHIECNNWNKIKEQVKSPDLTEYTKHYDQSIGIMLLFHIGDIACVV